jgi:hypothetical protein
MPEQPVDYSHEIHAGRMGMDCRYCHYSVEKAGFAAVPPTAVCLGCHGPTNEPTPKIPIKGTSPKLEAIRDVAKTDAAIPWIKVHDLPDYVFFNHSAHVAAGVGCVKCHGRIDQMPTVYQHETLSMGWCLDCHRNPTPNLRPPDQVTNMSWKPGDGGELPIRKEVNPPTHCSGCHR